MHCDDYRHEEDHMNLWKYAFCLGIPILIFGCASPVVINPPDSYENDAAAREAYEKELMENPNNAKVHQWLGEILLRADEIEAAEGHLHQSVEYDPSLTRSYLILGQRAEAAGELQKAIEFYDKALQGNPVFLEVINRRDEAYRRKNAALQRLNNANSLLVEGRYREAIDLLDIISEDFPNEPRVLEMQARAHVALAKIEQPYNSRKTLLNGARDYILRIQESSPSSSGATLLSEIESLMTEDEDQVARAREQVELGGEVFRREVCLGQKAPMLELHNGSGSQIVLDLRFRGDVRQTVVTANAVSLRTGPGTEFDRIASLDRGTPVWIKLRGDEYYNVVTHLGEGWISRSVLMNDRIVTLPIPARETVSVILAPGEADYRLGRGIRSLAEGQEEFVPYLCYRWP